MTLRADFNMRDRQGRVLAVLEPEQRGDVHVGEIVVVEDAEGNRCKATVAKLDTSSPAVAHLVLEPGSSEPSRKSDAIAELR